MLSIYFNFSVKFVIVGEILEVLELEMEQNFVFVVCWFFIFENNYIYIINFFIMNKSNVILFL